MYSMTLMLLLFKYLLHNWRHLYLYFIMYSFTWKLYPSERPPLNPLNSSTKAGQVYLNDWFINFHNFILKLINSSRLVEYLFNLFYIRSLQKIFLWKIYTPNLYYQEQAPLNHLETFLFSGNSSSNPKYIIMLHLIYQLIKKAINQESNQSRKQSIKKVINQESNQSRKQSIKKVIHQENNQSRKQSIKKAINQ